MKNKISRFWNDLPLFWKAYALSMIFASSIAMIGEGAEGLAKKLISLADLQIKSKMREAFLWLTAITASSLLGSWLISRIITGSLTRIQPVVERLSHGDYTPAGCTVIVRLRVVSDALLLDVIDQGPGVPEGKLDDTFRPFYQVDSARGRSSGGFGLGLAIARQATELHGGQIRAVNVSASQFTDDSKTGLKVTLTLPASKNAPTTIDARQKGSSS